MDKKLKIVFICLILLGLFLTQTACRQDKPIQPKQEYTYGTDYFDFSNVRHGFVVLNTDDIDYIQFNFNSTDKKVSDSYKIEDTKHQFILPLAYGTGQYTIKTYGNSVQSKTFTVDEIDTDVFTLSTSMVDYLNIDIYDIILEAYSSDELTFVKNIAKKVYLILEYREGKSYYFSDLDKVIKSGHGVCLEYARICAACIRSQNIPCKLVFGDYNGTYHAWCEVDINGEYIVDATSGIVLRKQDTSSYTALKYN